MKHLNAAIYGSSLFTAAMVVGLIFALRPVPKTCVPVDFVTPKVNEVTEPEILPVYIVADWDKDAR